MTDSPRTMLKGFRFPEGCRWHDGRLWFSDMHTGVLYSVSPEDSTPRVELTVDDQPSGLGWLPDGSLVVSCMLTRRIMRRGTDGQLTEYADLSAATEYPINDLIVDRSGRVIVGGFGYDLYADAAPSDGSLFGVAADGSYQVLADDLVFPNGMVILSSGVLVVAETFAARLTAYDIGANGELRGRRVWALLPEGSTPDGLCADAEDAVWVSSILPGQFLRVSEGGTVTDTISLVDRLAVDCVLGGPGGTTLLLSTADSFHPEDTARSVVGRIEAVVVAVPGPAS